MRYCCDLGQLFRLFLWAVRSSQMKWSWRNNMMNTAHRVARQMRSPEAARYRTRESERWWVWMRTLKKGSHPSFGGPVQSACCHIPDSPGARNPPERETLRPLPSKPLSLWTAFTPRPVSRLCLRWYNLGLSARML